MLFFVPALLTQEETREKGQRNRIPEVQVGAKHDAHGPSRRQL